MSLLVFGTRTYGYLQAAICKQGGYEAGAIARQEFPDGEHYRRIESDPAGRDVVLVGGTVTDEDSLEVFDLACTLVMQGAQSLTLVVPFFGYSTMERAVKPGEVVAAKTRAQLLSAIPRASIGDRIMLLDLHTEGLPYYFEGAMRPIHMYGKDLVRQAVRDLAPQLDNVVLAATDAGRAKWVESLANDMGVPGAFVFKRRLSGEKTELTAMAARVEGQHVIIYDDMIRTGGSLISAARAYKEAGAVRISAVTTHGVFPGDGLERIKASGLFDRVIATDSHPRARALEGEFLTVRSIAPLVCSHLEKHT